MKTAKVKFLIASVRKPDRIHLFIGEHGEPYQFDNYGEANEVLLRWQKSKPKSLPELKIVRAMILENEET